MGIRNQLDTLALGLSAIQETSRQILSFLVKKLHVVWVVDIILDP